MKALHMRILRGLAGSNMHELDLPLNGPGEKVTAGHLRAVITAYRDRYSSLGNDLVQHTRHSAAGKARIHLQRQTLPCKRIDHASTPAFPDSVRQPTLRLPVLLF